MLILPIKTANSIYEVSNKMQIKEITKIEEGLRILNLLKLQYHDIDKDLFLENLESLLKDQNSQLLAAIKNKEYIAILSLRIINKLNGKKIAFIEDFIAKEKGETVKIGKEFIDWLEKNNCQNYQEIEINLSSKNLESHKTFSQEKFILEGFYFKRTSNP